MLWTEEEKELLKEHYPLGNKVDLIRIFNRKWNLIQGKAFDLGISRLVKYKPSEETIKKIRQNCKPHWKGKHIPKEVRMKISQSKKGCHLTQEAKEKLSLANSGKKQSEDTKKKISLKNKGKIPWIMGKHHSEETKTKIRMANKGQVPWIKGKTHSPTSRLKLSLRHTGKKLSDETKKKLSEAMKIDRIDLSIWKDKIISDYKNGYEAEIIGGLYNVCGETIRRRLKAWNVQINRSKFRYTSIITKDGHSVNSNAEMIIDNNLFLLGISHLREKKIAKTQLKCDWYIPELNLYIEYWGLVGNDFYDKQKERKLEIYKENELNLISIFPSDLTKLHNVLNRILKLKEEKNKILTDFI